MIEYIRALTMHLEGKVAL